MPCELTVLARIGGPVWICFIPNSKLALGFLGRINSKGQSPVLCLQATCANAPFLTWEKEPAAARRLPEAKETKTVVSFCNVSEGDNGSITTINHCADCNSHENGWEQLLTVHYVLSYPYMWPKGQSWKSGFLGQGGLEVSTPECFLHACVCCCTMHTSQAVENESMCLSAVDPPKAMWCVYTQGSFTES